MELSQLKNSMANIIGSAPGAHCQLPHLPTEFVRDGCAVLAVALEQPDLPLDPLHLLPQLHLPLPRLLQAVTPHLLPQPPQRRVRLLQLDIRHLQPVNTVQSTLRILRNHSDNEVSELWNYQRLCLVQTILGSAAAALNSIWLALNGIPLYRSQLIL